MDLDDIRDQIEDHLGELPQDVTCCQGCRIAMEDVPDLLEEVEERTAEVDRLRREMRFALFAVVLLCVFMVWVTGRMGGRW